MDFQVTSLIWQKTSFFNPHMTPVDKMKIPYPYCKFARHAQSYIRVSIVYSWKWVWNQVTNFTEKKETSFSTLIWYIKIKWKFRNLIAHLQDKPNHIQEYHLSILWNVDRVPMTRTSPEMSFFGPYWPLGQKWKFQNLIAHLQDILNQILEYNLAMT